MKRLGISGNFKLETFRPNGEDKKQELQYAIDPPPHLNNMSNVTLMNTTLPVFSWDIHLKRLLLPYIIKTFVPMTTLVMTSWISFLIPPNVVPGRSGLLVTLLLVLTTFHLHELDQSPLISSVTPLLLWCEICLAFVLIAFLQYAFILYCARFTKQEKKKNRIRGTVIPIHSIVKQQQNKESNNSGNANENAGEEQNAIPNAYEYVEPDEDLGDRADDSFNMKTATMLDYYALRIVPIGFLFVISVYFIYFSI